ncbi:MAG: alpha-ribazole phosphatase [Sulfurimonas sp.]|jgi:alpha-ribazole phosphatase|uniref:histidine phosphatase family protein n=1 Tax=Sulfurimonas sp. TaxID=2022749 RepID=UPI0039E61C03
MIITLVRHAQVIEKYQGKYNGHIDIPLSENGKLQAIEIARTLKNENYDAIYCSDLLRAKQTLAAFDLQLTPIFTENLREKSWGIHEGKSFQEIEESGIKYINFEQWLNALDGESTQNYIKKTYNYFQKYILNSSNQNVLVMTHSGLIKSIVSQVLKIPIEESFSKSLPYASYIKLEKVNDVFRIL